MALSKINSIYIQNLLKLHPVECNIDRTVIITIAPRLWDKELLDENITRINISKITGLKSLWNVSRKENYRVKSLVDAGWPITSILPAYLEEISSPIILLKDGKGEIGLIYDVAELPRDLINLIGKNPVGDMLSILSKNRIQWGCYYDGEEYILVNAKTGEKSILDRIPSPEDIGITIANSGKNQVQSKSSIKYPSSAADFFSLLEAIQPDHIIFDHSLACEFKIVDDEKLSTFANALNDLVDNKAEHLFKLTTSGYWHAMFGLLSLTNDLETANSLSLFLPAIFLTHPILEPAREHLAQNLNPFAVIEYPDVAKEKLGYPNSILYLGGNRDATYFRQIKTVNNDLYITSSHPWFKGESDGADYKGVDNGYTAKVLPEAPWTFIANLPEIKRKLKNLSKFGEVGQLIKLCQIIEGLPEKAVSISARGPVAYIKPTDLPREFYEESFDFEHTKKISPDPNIESNILKQNDIIIRRKITSDPVATLYMVEQPAVVSEDLIVLRPITDRINSPYLREYLNSEKGKELLIARATTYCGHIASENELSLSMLVNFPVPTIENKMLKGWENIDHLEDKLVQKASDLRKQLQSLFESTDENVFRNSLGEIQRMSNLINNSVGKIDRLEFQIANFYPFPIAYGYRLLASKVNPTDLYREQLRVAENILAFLASVSLSILMHFENKDLGIDLSDYWRGGISPGDWKDIIQRCAKIFGHRVHPLVRSLQGLEIGVYQKGFGADVKRLIQAKNDFKHDRGPTTEEDILSAVNELQTTLDRVMQQLSFFTDFPIRMVQDIVPSRSGELTLKCLVYIGDHPGLYQEESPHPQPLPKGDLYLDMGSQKWIPLYPFTAAMNCPNCQVRETYFIDKIDYKKNSVQFKSYERGHTITRLENLSTLLHSDK